MISHVAMVGAFPPPVGGAAKNNALIFGLLQKMKVPVRKLDVSGGSLSHHRTIKFHIRRLRQNISASINLLCKLPRGSTAYIVPDGGFGVWYSLMHGLATLVRCDRIFIHHRTFLYVNHRVRAMKMMTSILGERATHIFLSHGMAQKFIEQYGKVNFQIASNAGFAGGEVDGVATRRVEGPLRIGHLSNLCSDKGFFLVADAYEAAVMLDPQAELHLAGPIVEQGVEARLESLEQRFGSRVRYYGPLTGEAKRSFYRNLDVFLFPTLFKQEAAPNVVYEAAAAGVCAWTTAAGCLPEMVPILGGKVCNHDNLFAEFVHSNLLEFRYKGESAQSRRSKIIEAFRDQSAVSQNQYKDILRNLSGQKIIIDELSIADNQF